MKKIAMDLIEQNNPGGHLLYLIKFGSELYGTQTPESDTDLKGIFLPSFESLVFREKNESISLTTGINTSKNDSRDIDTELWSLQYWLQLVSKGDTGALDLLYSKTNSDCIIYKSIYMEKIFNNPLSLFDPKNTRAYVGYCIGQAKKYGIKGSRLGVIKSIYEWLQANYSSIDPTHKAGTLYPMIVDSFGDKSYCFLKELPGTMYIHGPQTYLCLCGKMHQKTITIQEFYDRVSDHYQVYGERARKAERNEGLDFKALSHALRCILQCKQLLTEGKITFPFTGKNLENILNIKTGKLKWNEINPLIVNGLKEVEELQKTTSVSGQHDVNYVNDIILDFYKE